MHNGLVYKFIGKNHWNFYDWSEYLEGKLFADEEYKDTGILPQIIIVDHVSGDNLECKEEFNGYVRCNWRNGKALI